ncbi:MAG: M28 family metallopeptidase [Gaiellales bacterium]
MQLSPIAPNLTSTPVVHWGTPPQQEHAVIDRMNADETLGYISGLCANGPRVWGTASYDQAAAYVVDTIRALRQGGWDVHVEELPSASFGGRMLHDVVATRQGSAPADQRKLVVAGAHLDTVRGAPGANDDGSGSATLLSMAHALDGISTANDIKLVWFDGEEAGLLGSRAYVKAHPNDTARTVAMINMDMVGSPNGIVGQHDLGVHTSSALEDAVRAVELRNGLRGTLSDVRHSRSDHASFDNVGIPAVDFGVSPKTVDQEDPNYHSSNDTIDKINRDVLEGYGDLIGTVVLDMANRPKQVAANRPSTSEDVVLDGPPL